MPLSGTDSQASIPAEAEAQVGKDLPFHPTHAERLRDTKGKNGRTLRKCVARLIQSGKGTGIRCLLKQLLSAVRPFSKRKVRGSW